MNEIYFETRDERSKNIAKKLQVYLGRISLKRPLVVAIGGDGTMLHAVREHKDVEDALFVGVSTGSLGYLQAIEPNAIDQLADHLQNEDYEQITSKLIKAKSDSGQVYGYAFNEVLIGRNTGEMSRFDLEIDGSVGHFEGDGVIFATAVGSTAYAKAAGGPIVDPAIENAYVVVPSNPNQSYFYTSITDPHVVAGNRESKVTFDPKHTHYNPSHMVIDGQNITDKIEEPVNITLSNHKIHLMQLDGFFRRLEKKRIGRL